ncbi:MAG: hypothetical protein OXE99_07730 [Cellvibrionales bacterium]|nr:hypothetical protein [Cellvibrionales bacterium]
MKKCAYLFFIVFIISLFTACVSPTNIGNSGESDGNNIEDVDGEKEETNKVTTAGEGDENDDDAPSEDEDKTTPDPELPEPEPPESEDKTTTDDEKLNNYKLSGSVTGNRSDVIITLDGISQTVPPNGTFSFTVQENTLVTTTLFSNDNSQKCSLAIPDFKVTSDRSNLNFFCTYRYSLQEVIAAHNNAFTQCVNESYALQTFADLIDYIYCPGKSIDTIDGIEYFSELKTLHLPDNTLTSADISKNTALEDLDLSKNQLSYIDLSTLNNLEHLDLCENQLIHLDFPSPGMLKEAKISKNQITALNLPTSSSLSYLDASYNQILSENIAQAANLKHLDLSHNQLINTYFLTLHSLEYLDLSFNQLTTYSKVQTADLSHLNLDGNTDLTTPDVSSYNLLETLILPEHLRPKTWQIMGAISGLDANEQIEIRISGQSKVLLSNALFSADIEQGKLFTVEVHDSPAGKSCVVSHPQLLAKEDFHDVSIHCQQRLTVEEIQAKYTNNFISCATEGHAKTDFVDTITSINCAGKSLTTTEGINHFTGIATLDISNNQLTSIDFSYLYNLLYVKGDQNQLETVDLSPLVQVEEIHLYDNKLTSALDLTQLTNVKKLNLSNNQLVSVKFPKVSDLSDINLSNNKLISIDLDTAPALKVLNLEENNALIMIDTAKLPSDAEVRLPSQLKFTLQLFPSKLKLFKGQKARLNGIIKANDDPTNNAIQESLTFFAVDSQTVTFSGNELTATTPGETIISVSTAIGNANVANEFSVKVLNNQDAVGWNKDGKQDDSRYQDIVETAHADSTIAVVKSDGTVNVWGAWQTTSLADISSIQSQLVNVESISSTHYAFAALKRNGSVITWGDADKGGDATSVQSQLSNISQIVGTREAFAALNEEGKVILWGNPHYGADGLLYKSNGTTQSMISDLTNIASLYATDYGFAAITNDRKVITWGAWGDGKITPEQLVEINQLSNVVEIFTNDQAYAALLADGSVYTWGKASYGANSQAVQTQLTDIIDIKATGYAFAAIKSNGEIITWGDSEKGGDLSGAKNQLDDVAELIPNKQAFAALKHDGTVVTWGRPNNGGDSSGVKNSLVDVVSISSNELAFCAVKEDGSVVTWGDPWYAGEINKVPTEAKNIAHARGVLGDFIVIFKDAP